VDVDAARLYFQGESMWLLNAIIGLIMFGVALDIRVDDFRRIAAAPRGPAIGLLSQFFVLPAFTFLLTRVLDPAPSIALGMILVASCPGGNLSNFFTHLAGGNAALSVSMTAVSTLAAIVMTPFNVAFWGGLHPDTAAILRRVQLDPVQLTLTVLVILGIPLAAGMLAARHWPRLAARLQKPFKVGSVAFFILFVGYVFFQNYAVFTEYIGWVAFAVILHNAMALAAGYAVARVARLSARDTRAVSLEVGIQNSALGLTLIFGFFGGLGGMALIAGAWGIWHVIAGLALAGIWSRWPAERVPELCAPAREAPADV
jgi:BASS family bile acid:Na+ symporter